MNREEKILKIKEDRIELLKQVRESIINNKESVKDSLEGILTVLDFSENNIKKIESFRKSEELITSFVEEIINTNSTENIAKIRKRLNYQIVKVRDEIEKRNLGPITKLSYNDKVRTMREDISKYVRYLKRDVNLLEIDSLQARYEELSKEELKRLRYLIKLEYQYNENQKKPKQEVKKVKEKEIEEQPKKEKIDLESIKGIPTVKTSLPIPTSLFNVEYDEVKDYLEDKIDFFNHQYKLIETEDYGKDKKNNFLSFIRNLSKFQKNKKVIKRMEKDSCYFYKGSDLVSYIEYLKKRNSIRQSLEFIFHDSSLFTKEREYINRQKECSKWLFNFCKKNKMKLPLSPEKVR